MSLEEIQTEIAALRSDVKSLTKLVRKVSLSRTIRTEPRPPRAQLTTVSTASKKSRISFVNLLVFRRENWFPEVKLPSFTKYITEHGLKHPDNGRVLIMDEKLRELLKPGDVQVSQLAKVPFSALREGCQEGVKV